MLLTLNRVEFTECSKCSRRRAKAWVEASIFCKYCKISALLADEDEETTSSEKFSTVLTPLLSCEPLTCDATFLTFLVEILALADAVIFLCMLLAGVFFPIL